MPPVFGLSRQRLRAKAAKPTSAIVQVPAPYTGWNTRDALTAMPPTDAILLDNYFPDSGAVRVRKGSAGYATGLGAGNVETLAQYYSGATRKFIAACSGAVFDITGGGSSPTSLGSGFSLNRWQTFMAGGRLFLFNGTDAPQDYNGTALAPTLWSGSGLTITNLINGTSFKNRIFLVEKNSARFWYATSGTITGALSSFDLSLVGTFGGSLSSIVPISYDGGSGSSPSALLAFIMTSGETFVYDGTDPGDADHWSLVGQYKMGAPVSTRAVVQFGGDVYVTTEDDHLSINSWMAALRQGITPPRSKIAPTVAAIVATNMGLFGWEICFYPRGKYIFCNVPNSDGSFVQHIFNTTNQAWSRFKNLNASTWCVFDGDLFFGTSTGRVIQADTGQDDSGTAIQADAQQAWNNLGSPYRKRVTSVRPIIQSTGGVAYSLGIGFDYQDAVAPVAAETTATGSYWDVSTWDVAPWSPENGIDTQWRVGNGSGVAVSPRLRFSALQDIQWMRTDLRLERGDAL